MRDDDESFPSDIMVWADEATLKLGGTIILHNCVYWSSVNPQLIEEKALNLPGVTLWNGMSFKGLVGIFSLKGLPLVFLTYKYALH